MVYYNNMDTKEYQTLNRCAPQLEVAVQSELVTISNKLLSKGIVSERSAARLKDESKSLAERGASLVTMVSNKVKMKQECYNEFVEILKQSGIDVIQPLRQDKPRSMVCVIDT